MNLYIGLKFSLVICLQFIQSKHIYILARSQKQSLSKQIEDFDIEVKKWSLIIPCVHIEAVFYACIILTVKIYFNIINIYHTLIPFIAHLSQRLMGELILYHSVWRLSVVRQHFQTSPNPLGKLSSNFIWRLLRTRERRFL